MTSERKGEGPRKPRLTAYRAKCLLLAADYLNNDAESQIPDKDEIVESRRSYDMLMNAKEYCLEMAEWYKASRNKKHD